MMNTLKVDLMNAEASPMASSEGSPFITSCEPLTGSKNSDGSSHSNETSNKSKAQCLKEVLSNWQLAVVVLTPVLLTPLLIALPNSSEARCAYVLLLMAIYWCTEAVPLAATALMPIFIVPMFGLMPSSKVCINYLKDLNFLFVGGLMFAVAVEKWNLHKRIALGVLLIVGTKPKMLLFGFLSVTGFLSMWLSNTATTAMMIPIAHAVLLEMWKQKKGLQTGEELALKSADNDCDEDEECAIKPMPVVCDDPKQMDAAFQNLGKAVSLSICYGSSIGGTGTLTGTGPNLIIGVVMKEYFPESTDITFGSWMIFATPLMILSLFLCWGGLILVFFGPRALLCCKEDPSFNTTSGRSVIRTEYNKLGKMKFAEVLLSVMFVILGLLWLARDPKFAPGWTEAFKPDYVTDASTGIFICFLLFALPSSLPCLRSHKLGYKFGPPLLDWDSVQKKLPWGVIVLLGGGFALASVCNDSGLSKWIGCKLVGLSNIPQAALVLICCMLMTGFTEFTSNTSAANIFLPILAELAVRLQIHPLYLLIPVTICSSYAFSLPVATPPNAIVFSYGHLKVIDMVKAGMLMNFLTLGACMLAINTWGTAYFHLNEMPYWANTTKAAVAC